MVAQGSLCVSLVPEGLNGRPGWDHVRGLAQRQEVELDLRLQTLSYKPPFTGGEGENGGHHPSFLNI